MPVYLFTYHTYRSWMPDHPRGFVKEGEGYLLPNTPLANAYRDAARFEPVEFSNDTEKFVIHVARDTCLRRRWRMYAASTEPSHLHVLVGWNDGSTWQIVRGKIRNIISLELSKHANTFGRPWFSEGASRKRVHDTGHFDYLIDKYLYGYGGWYWSERHGWKAPTRKHRRQAQ